MSTKARVLYIGIAPLAQMRARTIAIARGEYHPAKKDPKVWFTSIESLAQVLSTKNQLLLEMIRVSQPASMRQLADLSGRKESNLSRTLHTMERYGLVRLTKNNQGRMVPKVLYDALSLSVPLAAMAAR
jgi:predicted transcriptional regulator